MPTSKPICGARTRGERGGHPCGQTIVSPRDGRCRMQGGSPRSGAPVGNTNFCGKDEGWREGVLRRRQRKIEARERYCALVLELEYDFTPEMLAKVKEIGGTYEQMMDIAYATWAKRHGFTEPVDTSRRALKARANAVVSRAKAAGLLPARRRYSTRKPRGGSSDNDPHSFHVSVG